MSPLTSPPRPLGIRSPHGANWFEIEWPPNDKVRLPITLLRGYCPCAGCQGHGGQIRYVENQQQELKDIEPVGNYALRLVFGDHHGSGLYAFDYLKALCDLYKQHGDELPKVHPTFPTSSIGQ